VDGKVARFQKVLRFRISGINDYFGGRDGFQGTESIIQRKMSLEVDTGQIDLVYKAIIQLLLRVTGSIKDLVMFAENNSKKILNIFLRLCKFGRNGDNQVLKIGCHLIHQMERGVTANGEIESGQFFW
jgi:hypothetical protein